jgi:DNA excision repair protein ERCC-4
MQEKSESLRIKIDTREQRPWKFPVGTDIVYGKLDEGDYAVEGLEGKFGIERKSLNDIWGSLTSGRDRFERELQRVKDKGYLKFIIIIEATPSAFCNPADEGRLITPQSLQATVRAWRKRYDIEFLFLKDRKKAAAYAKWWLSQKKQEWDERLWHEPEKKPFELTRWDCRKRKVKMK